jgi:hypothetical protein
LWLRRFRETVTQNGKAIPAVASPVEALTRGVVDIVHAPKPSRINAAANMLIFRISTLLLMPIKDRRLFTLTRIGIVRMSGRRRFGIACIVVRL